MLTDLLGLYEQTNNAQRVAEISRELYDINPTYATTKTLAEAMLSEGNYSGAIPYLNEASGLAENDERSEEHTSELRSRGQIVCRLLLAKKNHILITRI